VDILAHGTPPLGWWRNNTSVNLVLTVPELWSPPSTHAQRQACAGLTFQCVGSLLDTSARPQPSLATRSFPIDTLRAARAAGKLVVYLSLGTLVTGAFWAQLPPDENEQSPPATASAARSGQEAAHRVWSTAFEALGSASDILVVLAVGRRDGALRGLPPLPANFLPCQVVPQLEVLPLCAAFITHAGMGSVMEAVLHRVPLVALPVFADQPSTADAIHRAGIGVQIRLAELSAPPLCEAVRHVAAIDSPCRRAIELVAARMEAGGGVARAVGLLADAATRHRQQQTEGGSAPPEEVSVTNAPPKMVPVR